MDTNEVNGKREPEISVDVSNGEDFTVIQIVEIPFVGPPEFFNREEWERFWAEKIASAFGVY